nr:MAG TPA: hypothetical protein [Caudoviricetes sp.]
MENEKTKLSKLLFKTYLEVYLVYNNSRCPTELFTSYLMGRPMLMAFVCELGLKTLILQNGGRYRNIHLLNKLFDLINPETQHLIIQILDIEENEFRAMLSKNANIFIKWRYFTEDMSSCSADTKFIENIILIMAQILLGDSYIPEITKYFQKQS